MSLEVLSTVAAIGTFLVIAATAVAALIQFRSPIHGWTRTRRLVSFHDQIDTDSLNAVNFAVVVPA